MENTNVRHIEIICGDLNLPGKSIGSTMELLQTGATIPFIARYRKEKTGSLDEVAIASIRDAMVRLQELDQRRASIMASLESQDVLTPELSRAIESAATMAILEDLYLPYRPKRKTRASVARQKGLEGLAKQLMAQGSGDPLQMAKKYVDAEKGVEDEDAALAGARDIMAEWVSEDASVRGRVRRFMERETVLTSVLIKGNEEKGEKYKAYFDWAEPASKAPSHRLLAMLRAENEGIVKLGLLPPFQEVVSLVEPMFVKGRSASSGQVSRALEDGCKRLLLPSLETELRGKLKERADKKAIEIFGENLRQLLLAPPLGQKRIMAIDPGFRTGCKVVCLDEEGKLLHNENIYPHPPVADKARAISKIQALVSAYNTEAIAIGNATAGRETEQFIRSIRFQKDVQAIMVNESGASVYSASDVAREEFPDYDITVRGAVSIGRRLADPLSELVKIDPKSIGVGQYQHDVDQKLLKLALDEVVMHCVNAVGVELNTASKELLSYVSGIGPALAAAIVKYRNERGAFSSRKQLLGVPRLGARAYEQAAGFIRVAGSNNPLDRSGVHPESYGVVEKMARDLKVGLETLINDKELRSQIRLEDYVSESAGMPTLEDIMKELARPGRDPRASFDFFEFDANINNMRDLREGMVLPGIVTNITAFGAFVDIGVHQDGLVHISHLANGFVSDPANVVRLNQKVRVRVMDVDVDRKRIGLSMKEA